MFNSSSKPRRGAPRGNTNAVKHGLYSQQFRRSDIEALKNARTMDLADEINVVRVFIRRITELNGADTSLSEALETLRILSIACICLTRLINTQRIVHPGNQAMDELQAALEEFGREYERKGQTLYDPTLITPAEGS
jgi:hypothetical protein